MQHRLSPDARHEDVLVSSFHTQSTSLWLFVIEPTNFVQALLVSEVSFHPTKPKSFSTGTLRWVCMCGWIRRQYTGACSNNRLVDVGTMSYTRNVIAFPECYSPRQSSSPASKNVERMGVTPRCTNCTCKRIREGPPK